jgi:cobalt/nickel transport system permease protein
MHIPDGFLDGTTALATGLVSAAVVTFAVRRESRELGERSVPLLGVTAAFVFAAQMLNFPVAGGTSGHFLGAVLVGALMGPWAACIVLTVVLAVQAVGMADGGITALGANVLNMAVIGGIGGYGLFMLLKRLLPRRPSFYFISLAIAAWASVVAASAAASVELAVSGTVPLRITLPAMTSVHMIIGIGEALITVTVVAAVLATRPDLVKTWDLPLPGETARRPLATRRQRSLAFLAGALVVAAALAVFVSPFASSSPDGLERVAEDKGFAATAVEPVWRFSPLADYAVPGLGGGGLSTAVAGLVGTLALFGLALGAGMVISRSRRPGLATPDGHLGAPHPMGGHEHADHRHAGHHHEHTHDAPPDDAFVRDEHAYDALSLPGEAAGPAGDAAHPDAPAGADQRRPTGDASGRGPGDTSGDGAGNGVARR